MLSPNFMVQIPSLMSARIPRVLFRLQRGILHSGLPATGPDRASLSSPVVMDKAYGVQKA
jgi:hypothetical protein